jgi:hypothetical protein
VGAAAPSSVARPLSPRVRGASDRLRRARRAGVAGRRPLPLVACFAARSDGCCSSRRVSHRVSRRVSHRVSPRVSVCHTVCHTGVTPLCHAVCSHRVLSQAHALLMGEWRAHRRVFENYNSTSGTGGDVGNANPFYHCARDDLEPRPSLRPPPLPRRSRLRCSPRAHIAAMLCYARRRGRAARVHRAPRGGGRPRRRARLAQLSPAHAKRHVLGRSYHTCIVYTRTRCVTHLCSSACTASSSTSSPSTES